MRLEDFAPRPGDILLAGAEKIAPRTPPAPMAPTPIVNVKTRRYDMAVPSNTTSDWLAWSTSGNYEILHGWRRVAFLTRDLERNNPHVRAFLRELIANVLGANGIQLRSRVPNQKGPNLNAKLNKTITAAWKDFRRKGVYDVTGTHSGTEADRLILRALARDGECLVRLIKGFRGNKYRFAVQLLEADTLNIWYSSILTEGKRVSLGVEMDNYGKPTGYYLLDYFQQDVFAANSFTARQIRVDADELVHYYIPDRITQNRGMSWFASTGTKFRTLERYEEAIAISNRIAAAKMGFLYRDKDAPRYKGQAEAETGELIEEVSPGEIIDLPPGVRFEKFDPSNPTESYTDFRKNILRSVASGLGISYNTLANDLESVNYSSARFGRDIELETWRMLQGNFGESVLQPIFNAWVDQATLTGALDGVTFDQAELIKLSAKWRARGFPYVDPVKDLQGSAGSIDAGLTYRRRELEELGLELEEVYEELAAEAELAKDYGLSFINPFSKMPAVEPTQEGESPEAGAGPGGTKPANGKPAGKKPAAKPTAQKQRFRRPRYLIGNEKDSNSDTER
jgi:lambda family phage portal protein